MLKADLHVHTCYSPDCLTPLEKIVEECVGKGINCLAIADHNTIAGALKLREAAPFRIIVAEEILTTMGEIMGLFLAEKVPQGLSPEEAITRIKSQGGLVAVPHPFGRLPFGGRHKLFASPEVVSQIDIIEVFNSRTPFSRNLARAQRLASEQRKVASAGSDAHTLGEIGRAYVEMPEFDGVDDFLDCLAKGKIFGQKSSSLVHFVTTWAKVRRYITRNSLLDKEKRS